MGSGRRELLLVLRIGRPVQPVQLAAGERFHQRRQLAHRDHADVREVDREVRLAALRVGEDEPALVDAEDAPRRHEAIDLFGVVGIEDVDFLTDEKLQRLHDRTAFMPWRSITYELRLPDAAQGAGGGTGCARNRGARARAARTSGARRLAGAPPQPRSGWPVRG